MTWNIAKSEYNLIRLLRSLFNPAQRDILTGLLHKSHPPVTALSSDAMAAVKESLAKGSVIGLAMLGWQKLPQIAGDRVMEQRWWQQEAKPLIFTRQSLELLNWLLVSRLSYNGAYEGFSLAPRSMGDEVLMLFTARALVEQACVNALTVSPAFVQSALVVLCECDSLSKKEAVGSEVLQSLNWKDLFSQHAWLLLALQGYLRRRWRDMERSKQCIHSAGQMLNLGKSQTLVLARLFQFANEHQRYDLLGFTFLVAADIMSRRPDGSSWLKSMEDGLSLEQQVDVAKASMAFFQGLEDQQELISRAGSARFFDDDYQLQQFVLRQWQSYGEDNRRWATQVINRMNNLQTA